MPPSDTISRFYVLSHFALVVCGYLAVAGSGTLDAPTIALTAAGLAIRALMLTGLIRWQPTEAQLAALILAYFGYYALDWYAISKDFLAATVHLVFFAAVARVLTAATPRHYFQVKVIAFLELLAASILSGNLTYFLFLAAFLLCAVATFAVTEVHKASGFATHVHKTDSRRFSRRLAVLTVAISLGVLTIASGLFFVLPRTARAAFKYFPPVPYHLTGFANEVRLGEIGEIKQSSAPVMHIRIFSNRKPTSVRWKGSSLASFDGVRWFNADEREEMIRLQGGLTRLYGSLEANRFRARIGYEVQLNPEAGGALFFTGTPEILQMQSPYVLRNTGGGLRVPYTPSEQIRYGAYSLTDDPPPASLEPLTDERRTLYLVLPATDPRVAALARQITANAVTDAERARAIEHHLETSYPYTLDLPKQAVPDPIADFLFDRRRGHCEYFASSMAVMLRTIGIPSRVATGFQPGEFNSLTGWHVIRASDAHSWVEAWLPGRGWTPFDPTPSAPPSMFAWLSKAGLFWDAAEVFWQEWVLSYNVDRQVQLAWRTELAAPRAALDAGEAVRQFAQSAWAFAKGNAKPAAAILALIAAFFFAGPPFVRWLRDQSRRRRIQRGKVELTDAAILYQRMLAMLARYGYRKQEWITPREFTQTMYPPEVAAIASEATERYYEFRFGGRAASAARMLEELDRLKIALTAAKT